MFGNDNRKESGQKISATVKAEKKVSMDFRPNKSPAAPSRLQTLKYFGAIKLIDHL
jgi:hypothetical protein